MLAGVTYLHTHGIIHRDLRPEHIHMVSNTPGTDEYLQIKLCGYELSTMRSIEAKILHKSAS